jgi:hypothetical protein
MLLNDPEWSQWSDREIARRANVGHQMVGATRESLSGRGDQIAKPRKVQRGETIYTQRTENIRKRGKSWDEFTESSSAAQSGCYARVC